MVSRASLILSRKSDYRKEHNLGKAREPRPWFSKSWYISTQVIKDVYARFVGDKFVGIMDNLGK